MSGGIVSATHGMPVNILRCAGDMPKPYPETENRIVFAERSAPVGCGFQGPDTETADTD